LADAPVFFEKFFGFFWIFVKNLFRKGLDFRRRDFTNCVLISEIHFTIILKRIFCSDGREKIHLIGEYYL
jgi:hypothetical protein